MEHLNDAKSEFSDESIMAFLDGELDQVQREIFEQALQNDHSLAHKVDKLRHNDAMLAGSLSVALDGPLPSIEIPADTNHSSPKSMISKLARGLSFPSFSFTSHLPAVAYSGAVLGLGILIGNLFPVSDKESMLSEASFNEARVVLAAINLALEKNSSDTRYEWSSPDLSSRGGVTPLKTWKTTNNQYCREYRLEWVKDQSRRSKIETACRSSSGSWQTDIVRKLTL